MSEAAKRYRGIVFSTAAAVLLISMGYCGRPGSGDTVWLTVTIYDHYAMNTADAGYFEFNPNGAGSANPSVCEGTTTGMVEDRLDADGLPVLRDYFPCIYNVNLNSWFRDDPNNPNPKKRVIKMTQKLGFAHPANGICHYNNPDFYPLDGKPGTLVDLGIEELVESADQRMHNNGYTLHFQTRFTYRESTANSAKLAFTGGDDVWVFIDGKLVMDFGGIHNRSPGPFTLKKIVRDGLVDLQEGKDYTLDFFFAKRHTHNSGFNLSMHRLLLEPFQKSLTYYVIK